MDEAEAPEIVLPTPTAVVVIGPAIAVPVPALVAAAGERAALRFLDFFTANIRNPNTRAAYAVAVRHFFAWLDQHASTTCRRTTCSKPISTNM